MNRCAVIHIDCTSHQVRLQKSQNLYASWRLRQVTSGGQQSEVGPHSGCPVIPQGGRSDSMQSSETAISLSTETCSLDAVSDLNIYRFVSTLLLHTASMLLRLLRKKGVKTCTRKESRPVQERSQDLYKKGVKTCT
jgi:hypothetical protein